MVKLHKFFYIKTDKIRMISVINDVIRDVEERYIKMESVIFILSFDGNNIKLAL